MKKFSFLLILMAALSLSACSGEAEEQIPAEAEPEEQVAELIISDQADFIWQIAVPDYLMYNALNSEELSTLYDGSVQETAHDNQATAGNIFVLVKLNINKAEAGNNSFSWADLSLEDSEGNRYPRLENDSFIENHGYSRLPGTDLVLGQSEGYICFEVSEAAANGQLYIVHQAAEGENRIQIQ